VAKATNIPIDVKWLQITATDTDWKTIGKAECIKMLTHLHIIRAFEETLSGLNNNGLIHGPLHLSIGHDGAVVGAMSELGTDDLVNGSHRGHHVFLAKALNHVHEQSIESSSDGFSPALKDTVYRTMAEIMGLQPGYSGGRGGSMHLRWKEAGVIGTNAIVGGGVPTAAGAAWSQQRDGQGKVVLTAFGDGSCHIGNVLETFNLAALYDLPLCFYIENNGYAVSTTVAEQARETRMSARGIGFGIPSFKVDGMDPVSVRMAMQQVNELLRSGQGPAVLEVDVYRFYHHSGGVKGSAFGYREKEEEREWIARDPLRFMEAKMTDLGWLSHDDCDAIGTAAAELTADAAAKLTVTNNGTRTIREELWPDPNTCDDSLRSNLEELEHLDYVEQENFTGELAPTKFITSIAKNMVRRFDTDDRLFVLGEDVHKLIGGTNGATKGIPERWPDRCVPTPIAEHGFVGLAGGVAVTGKYRPVVELMYPDFGLVAADQLFNQIAKARHMFGGTISMPLVLRTKVAIGTGYGSQHSMDPAGLFSMWPGWRIVAPSNPFDYVGLMNSALLCEDPVLVIESVELYNKVMPAAVDNDDYFIALGTAKVVREGAKFTVLTYLNMVGRALDVCEEHGIDAEIIDLRSLDRAGLDWETIGASIEKTNHVIVLEQGCVTNSYGGLVVEEVQKRYFDHLDHPVRRIHGSEASPVVSKPLERAAFVGAEEILKGFEQAIADQG